MDGDQDVKIACQKSATGCAGRVQPAEAQGQKMLIGIQRSYRISDLSEPRLRDNKELSTPLGSRAETLRRVVS